MKKLSGLEVWNDGEFEPIGFCFFFEFELANDAATVNPHIGMGGKFFNGLR